MQTVIHCGRLIDGVGDEPLENATLIFLKMAASSTLVRGWGGLA
ncbi:MAG: hypothetical protein R2873_03800 [Caldilineaceae bacterium]